MNSKGAALVNLKHFFEIMFEAYTSQPKQKIALSALYLLVPPLSHYRFWPHFIPVIVLNQELQRMGTNVCVFILGNRWA